MFAISEWLFAQGAATVYIHPDGMHAKFFDIAEWLRNAGFHKVSNKGKAPLAGVYRRRACTIEIDFRSGAGDVVGEVKGDLVFVEAKGGCINSRNPGQLSKLRKHLYEAVGSLLGSPENARLIAAVPEHRETRRLAERMAARCHDTGIQVALVSADGAVRLQPDNDDLASV